MAFFGDLVELSCHMNTDAWARLSDSTLIGTTPRYVAIFSYVEQPDMVGSPERTEQLYGRTLPIHWERAGKRKDTYID